MDSNQKKFNIFVFLSTFARNLVELFIPIILYNFGYTVKEILFYIFMNMFFSLLLTYPCVKFANKYGNKTLFIIGIIFFALMQILLCNVWFSCIYLILIAFCFSMYRRGYWLARRYYNLKVMHKDNISTNYSWITIINQLGIVIASYIGSLVLDYFDIKYLNIVSIILFILSIVPLCFLRFEHKETDSKIEIIKTLKSIPKRNLYLFATYELWYIVKLIFPLYLYLYVKDTYQTVGLLNLVTNLATMIFAYFYGKKINNEKNMLRLSIILTVIIYLCKLNVTSILLTIVCFIEGIVTKMYEISVQKEFYVISKKFEYHSYNCVYDLVQCAFRVLITLFIFYFVEDLRIMIMIPLAFILSSAIFNVKKIKQADYKKE